MHRQITEAADQWEAMERDPGCALPRHAAGSGDGLGRRPSRDAERARDGVHRRIRCAGPARGSRSAKRSTDASSRPPSGWRTPSDDGRSRRRPRPGRLRRRAIALTGALGLAAVLGVVALAFGQQARVSLADADSQRLGAEASGILQRGESAELAALLAIRGIQSQYTPQADAALATGLPPAVQRPHRHAAPARGWASRSRRTAVPARWVG